MKVLCVIHDFLPRHAAGAEIYAYDLCKELAGRHEIVIFCTEHRPGFTQYALRERDVDGLSVVEMVNNHCQERFEETYDNPHADAAFRRIIGLFKPDVIHVHSLMYHSVNYLPIAADASIPVVHTVHDFWFNCEQEGKRLRADRFVCYQVVPSLCSACLATRPTIAGRWTRAAYQMFVSFRWMSGINLASLAGRLRAVLAGGGEEWPALKKDGSLAGQVAARNAYILERFRLVDRFLCPSAYLRDELVRFGVDPERAIVSGYGLDTGRLAGIGRKPSEAVRFGFIGTVAPIKGVDILLEAFGRLDQGQASLTIWGSLTTFPTYVRRLRRLAEGLNVSFKGGYGRRQLAEVLSGIDVLVVPSVWFENQPLSIQEAYLAGVPVIASRLGGMAESVVDGKSGLLFMPGDANDLAARMGAVVTDRGLIERLAAGLPAVRSIREDAAAIERLYADLAAAGGGSAP